MVFEGEREREREGRREGETEGERQILKSQSTISFNSV